MIWNRIGFAAVVAFVSGAACTDLDSATNLNPEGPPMIRQVRMKEVYTDATGSLNDRDQPVFAFGSHPQVKDPANEQHPVTSARAEDNKLRVIMDELLVGNYLEEIACRAAIDTDAYDAVPIGTTPDDIARCSVAKDVLPSSCNASDSHSVCLCKLDTGCGDVPKGASVGVLDINQDGAADDTRFIRGAVGIRCGSIDVPLDMEKTYWNPSGDQNVPAMGGFDALGPALVLVPAAPAMPPVPSDKPLLPTNLTCGLTFADSVVDKQGNKVCAPADGDIAKGCSPGQLDNFSFKVQPLTVRSASANNMDVGVSRTDVFEIRLTAPPSAASAGVITVREGATNYTQFTATMPLPTTIRLTWTAAGGLTANTMYTITLPTTVTDLFNQPMPMPVTITFTTGS
jgi:hypothetical protein